MVDDLSDTAGRNLETLIAAAKSGDQDALGDLIGSCRGYLLALAQDEVGHDLRAKMGASDIVQETCIKVANRFENFRGDSRAELFGWLRTILQNNMHDARRKFRGTAGRDVTREVSIDQGKSAFDRAAQLAADQLTPGSTAAYGEQVDALKLAMQQLPEDYQRVIEMRNWKRLPFAEIGRSLDRTEEAARKLWSRAVVQLTELMKEQR